MTVAIVSGWSAAICAATFALLCVLAVWDCRRTFSLTEQQYGEYLDRDYADPVDFEGEIHAYKIARDLDEERAAR